MPAAPQDWAVVAVTAGEGVVGWSACAGSPPVPCRMVGQPPSPGPTGPQVLASPPAVGVQRCSQPRVHWILDFNGA